MRPSQPFIPLRSAMTLGLSLKLSPDAVASLQQSRYNDNAEKVNEGHSCGEHSSDFSQDDDDRARITSLQQQDGEDWDNTMAVSSDFLQDIDNSDCIDGRVQDDDSIASENSDEISLSPPPSLPLVVVDLERLCGFVPSTTEEAQELKQQVIEALSRDDDDGGSNTNETEQHESLSQHFETHVTQLFETQMAHHGDTTRTAMNDANDLSKTIIEYPEFLCRSDTDPPSVMVTARQWKRLLKPHKISVVHKLLQHLKDCNRPLSWKIDMYEELSLLVKREEEYRQSQLEESQLVFWKTQRRKQQLDQLYQVRESFDHQLDAATEKLEVLEQECDVATAKELQRLRLSGKVESSAGAGGLAALDFDTSIFSFGTERGEQSLTSQIRDDMEDESGNENSECNDSDYDSTSQSDNNEATGDASLPAVDAKERSKARQKAALKTRRRRLESQQEAAKELARIEQAYEEEERVRESCTTPELRMAQGTVKSLEERMQQVDDLLESLQEEEWADEEEGILQTRAESTASGSHVSSSNPATARSTELSLLDSILAMILGSLPQSVDTSTADHYKFIRKEHQDVVSEWKEYFGRLPPSPPVEGVNTADTTTTAVTVTDERMKPPRLSESDNPERPPTVDELKTSFGIADNTNLDWDDSDDDEEANPSSLPPRSKKVSVGLRPGGKAMR